jgi:hypothetical protein
MLSLRPVCQWIEIKMAISHWLELAAGGMAQKITLTDLDREAFHITTSCK